MAPFVHSTIDDDVVIKSNQIPDLQNFDIASLCNGRADRNVSGELVMDALQKRVQQIDHDTCDAGDEDAFFVADLGEVYRHHMQWKTHLKRVEPHYAVKCNPDPLVLRLLAELGTGFDCASKTEIDQVLSLGVDSSRIIYAQPCKTKSYIRYAAQREVKKMTFDNADELYKIKQFFPDAELLLRILTDDSASLCRLSLKFGASLESTKSLLELASKLQLNVVGVAFHVGSGASDPKAFIKAVKDSRVVFDQAADLGLSLTLLDVGGGFCNDTFKEMAKVLSCGLEQHFPPHVRIIGEPGRYYVSSAYTIACHVIARRSVEIQEKGRTSYMLYLNDGVYGNFSSIIFDHQKPIPQPLRVGGRFLFGQQKRLHEGINPTEYSVWGPTCDGIDCITESCSFTQVLDVGDWLFFENMGAYTKCSATRFNGFTDKHDILYVSSEPRVNSLLRV